MRNSDHPAASIQMSTGLDVRRECRSSRLDGTRAGLAPGYVQGISPSCRAIGPMTFCASAKPTPSRAHCSACPRPEGRRCRRSAPALMSAPTSRAIACGGTASSSPRRPTSCRSGATTSSASSSAVRSRLKKRCCRTHSAPSYRMRMQCSDVPHQHRHAVRRTVSPTAGGVDAADEAGRCDPRHSGDDAAAGRARRACAYRFSGSHWNQGSRQARLRRCRSDRSRRVAGVLGHSAYRHI